LDRGSLEEGKRADLVVLTEDPFSVPEARLKEAVPRERSPTRNVHRTLSV
jgi:predicted amidohydrolase YtcJ